MENYFQVITLNSINKNIKFVENFYLSTDKKTIMGEIPFQDILFLDYRDSQAGSNPREYAGLKKTNANILKSLFKDSENMFRFLHSGIIVSITNHIIIEEKKLVKYEDCCLTNGNQSRFLILIVLLLKLYSIDKDIIKCEKKSFEAFIFNNFKNSKIKDFLKNLKFSKVKEVINFLSNNKKYFDLFNKLNIENFINSRLRIQINLIDNITVDLESKLDEFEAGTLIAEANNDTQKVKIDDIFGNKYKKELGNKIFNNFKIKYPEIQIEYRLGEILDTTDKVHILTLLRPIIATGILTNEKDIFNLSNQRDPIYKIFEKLLKSNKDNKTINIVSLLIPFLYDIRVNYVVPKLKDLSRSFIRTYKEKAIAGEIDDSYLIHKEVEKIKEDDFKLSKIIKTQVNYNQEHIFLALIYTVRKLIFFSDERKTLELNMIPNSLKNILNTLIESIFEHYIEKRMKGLPSSLTTFVRSEEFFKSGNSSYLYLKNKNEITESNFIDENKKRILL